MLPFAFSSCCDKKGGVAFGSRLRCVWHCMCFVCMSRLPVQLPKLGERSETAGTDWCGFEAVKPVTGKPSF